MRWLITLAAMAGLAITSPASADIEPILSPEDARIGIVHPVADQPITLRVASGSTLTVLMPPGDPIQSVVLSDSDAWHIEVSGGQDSIFVHGLRPAALTIMSVRTGARSYDFTLTAASSAATGGTMPLMVRVVKDEPASRPMLPPVWTPPTPTNPNAAMNTTYRMSGNKTLLPASIRDDGAKISITWNPDQIIPAVFVVDALGQEQMVDGYMRGGVFTIDRIYDTLLFRVDKAEAMARRIPVRKKR